LDVFELRERLVADYRRYARSFLPVKDERIRERLHRELDSGLLWPDPPVQLNPAFAAGGTVADLVGEGLLHEECERIFRVGKDPGEVGGDGEGGGRTMLLHRHQAEAIRESARDRSYVLTTGTGSGKSLAYIVPAVDHALHSGARDGRLKTLIVYPMNALANSQMGELEKFLRHGYPEGGGPVSYARYTGQESDEEREAILASPPDILLTNYVMLEYILTRPRDRRLIQNAGDLRYLVLDELHTYRGRQGADVGLLARRVRAACGSESLRMVGTSATLAGSGSFRQQREEVATVASRIFGTPVLAESVIGETLRPATAEADLDDPEFKRALRARVEAGGAPEGLADLVADPLARWIERTLGIRWSEEDRRLERQQPLPISGGGGASEKLAAATGVAADACEAALRETLLAGARTQRSDLPFPVFAFRLHQFLSGGATFWASLDGEQERHISSSGQQFVPGDKERVLLPLCFCRECGQEYYCVRETGEAGGTFVPRQISDHSVEEDDRDGFLYLSSSDPWPSDVEGVLDRVPPDWLDPDSNSIRKSQRRYLPSAVAVNRSGVRDPAGVEAAFLTAPFRFCLACGVAYGARLRSDFSKLASLGAGGRSTSTDILGLSTLDYLRGVEDMEKSRRKILSFTDNRQDASLQAGHFNDFVEVSLLRSALYKAAAAAGPEGLDYTQVAPRTLAQTGLTPAEYAAAPELKGGARAQRDSAMHEVVAYRIYADQMRWRLTSPNLEQAGLIELGYAHLDECVADEEEFGRDLPEWFTGEERAAHPALADADPATRREVARVLLDFMRRELALSADQLDRTHQEGMAANSRQHLTDPWVIEEHEELSYAAVLFPRPRRQGNDSRTGVFLSPRGAFGSFLRRNGTFPHLAEPLDLEGAAAVIAGLLAALRAYGLVSVAAEPEEDGDVPGFQLQVSELRWIAGDGTAAFRDQLRIPTASSAGARTNPFFVELYRSLAGSTGAHVSGREHTAQVPAEIRAEREAEFRSGDLPLLFCSPTMELGVDIADLNVVNLRNVPPTPANYAQRSGRAGRGGDPALVYTYCSSWSNHDRYFFRRSNLMVSGKVSPPALDLGNEDLLRAHVHAIWLAETGAGLGGSMTEVLDTDGTEPTLAVREHLAAQLRNAAAAARAKRRAAAIFATLADDLATADWYDEGWLDRTLDLALDAFDRACERWRELFRAARAALDANHQVTLDASASRRSKQDAQRLYREAVSQLDLLGATPGDTYQSDFYPYRYFAGEGFLPGYNFPRLPLSAFIPARRRKGNADDFLSRPRFLAIAEFGPRSVIYHEGSRYIVNRVILPAAEQEGVPLSRAKSCPDCGYLHEILDGDGLDLCERCHADLGAATGNLLRLQNVTTRRRDRISSNEEERQRQGYDLRTSVRFDGHSFRAGDVRGAGGDELAELQYGGAATIWRINLGWSRRADKAVQGFGLDMKSGFWQRNDQLAETDPEDPISAARVKRVIPYVEDRRNALLFDPRRGVLGEAAMATLEAALKQGIQAVFQLEDSELAAEPLPERGDRRLLLFYEASEGGAGALRRLFEADRVAAVAREALSICHFDPETGADLGAVDRDEPCEAGCYDCLLSYSNQRDHRLIDRHLVRDFLLALAGAGTEVRASERGTSERVDELKARCDSELERRFLDLLVEQGRRLPTHAQKLISEERARPDFTYVGEHLPVAVFVDGPHHEDGFVAAEDAQTRARLEDAGYQVVAFPHDRDWPEILDRHPSIFGAAGGGG
jgi:hypothetical protein